MRVTVGRQDYAERAAGFGYHYPDLDGGEYGEYDPNTTSDSVDFLPDGWKALGAGVNRTAYLGPDGVVYKVPAPGCGQANHYEKDSCARLAYSREDCVGGWTVPYCTLYGDVLATEYIHGSYPDDDEDDEWQDRCYDSGVSDMHRGNAKWHYRLDVLVIIDLY
jgi:hypothetical protein